MTSTYLSYRVYTQDLKRTLARTAAAPQTAREAQYFQANISSVKSVDDLLKNDRLYNYAMEAAGLSDMIKSKAFMKKVLSSDLTDPRSFARSLVDSRYVAFARMFNFAVGGAVRANQAIAQSTTQEDATVGLYSEHRIRQGQVVAKTADAYSAGMQGITTVATFLGNETVRTFALEAFGIDPKIASFSFIAEVLTSDLADPESKANKVGGAYRDLAAAFRFGSDGQAPDGLAGQSDVKIKETIVRWLDKTNNGASPKAAALKNDYYTAAMAEVASVDDVVGNRMLFDYVVTAYGLDPVLESPLIIRDVLTSNLDDPESFANTAPQVKYRDLARAFNFNADGTITGTEGAQTEAQRDATIDLFMVYYDDKAVDAETRETTFFKSRVTNMDRGGNIVSMRTVAEVLADTRVYRYLLEAYDLDPDTESKATIERVLTSDLADPRSFANGTGDERYKRLAAAFNFTSDGKITTPRGAQTDVDRLATIRLFNSRQSATLTAAERSAVSAESEHYNVVISSVQTVDQLIADKRARTYILTAFGFKTTEKVDDKVLKQVLTSDPFDAKSAANKLGDTRYRDMAAAFNFGVDGKVLRVPEVQVQTRTQVMSTAELFLMQKMEKDAGETSEGVRLALYFRRKAPAINSALNILADKALIEVVRTALGLPASFSQMDLDKQINLIESRIKIADLKDPEKLDKFLTRFGVFYDQNNQDTRSSPTSLLFSGRTQAGFSDGLLSNLQRLRLNA